MGQGYDPQRRASGDSATAPPQIRPGLRTGRLREYYGDHANRFSVHDYTPDRSRAGPERVLGASRNHLQADAYAVHHRPFTDESIVEVGCWMQARQRCHEARTGDA